MSCLWEFYIAKAFGLLGGLYVAFVIVKPISKLDFVLRGSVSLVTGYILSDTVADNFSLDIRSAAFLACLCAWPFIGLIYRLTTNPKIFIELIKAWKK